MAVESTMPKAVSISGHDVDKKETIVNDNVSEIAGVVIELDPEKEAACRRKFDKYLLPTVFIFMILAVLDRNNVRQFLP